MPSDRQPPFDHKESLSAAMDGSSHELELHRALGECETNTALRQRWMRYHVVSAVIQKQPAAVSDSLAFANAVRAAIDAQEKHTQHHWKIMSRIAIAASVAVVVVAGAQWQQSNHSASVQQLAKNTPATEQKVSLPTQSMMAATSGSLNVSNIFTQSGDKKNMRFGVQPQFENASLHTEVLRVPYPRK